MKTDKEIEKIWEEIKEIKKKQEHILGRLWEYKGKDF